MQLLGEITEVINPGTDAWIGRILIAIITLFSACVPIGIILIRYWIGRTDTTKSTEQIKVGVTAMSRRMRRLEKRQRVLATKRKEDSTRFKTFQEKVESDVEATRKEVTANGGGSLKDAVVRLTEIVRLGIAQGKQIVWESDAKGRCIWASPEMCRILHREANEILGDNWRSFVHEDDRAKVYEEWDSAIRQQRPFRMTFHWTRSDEKVLAVNAHATCIKTGQGIVTGWVATVVVLGKPRDPETGEEVPE